MDLLVIYTGFTCDPLMIYTGFTCDLQRKLEILISLMIYSEKLDFFSALTLTLKFLGFFFQHDMKKKKNRAPMVTYIHLYLQMA